MAAILTGLKWYLIVLERVWRKGNSLSRVFYNITIQKHQFIGTQFIYSPTLTFIYDYWKNDSFD